MKTLKYKDDVEKEVLKALESGSGLVLIAEHIHKDGNFLVFGEPKPLSLEDRLAALEARVAAMEKKP